MKNSISKTKMTAVITVVLLLASVALLATPVQPVKAQVIEIHSSDISYPGMAHLGPLPAGVTPAYSYGTYAYLSFRPNPIGVGQSLLVNVWTTPGDYHAFYRQGYKVTMQKPDGTTIVVGPFNSYCGDASAWFEFVPDQAGTWKLKFENPGTYIPAGSYVDSPTGQAYMTTGGNYTLGASVYYEPSSTDWQELEVQQDMVSSWPPSPLPTDYWTRPVNPMNREWWPILGNYPFTGEYYYEGGRVLYASNYKYTAYVAAPNSAHIVWKRLGNIAGLVGGEEYQSSLSASPGTPTIIYSGRCYDTVSKPMLTLVNGTYRTLPVNVWQCYDLRTGEVYWELTDVTEPSIILYEQSTSEPVPGAEASQGYSVYLMAISGGRLIKYNPYTGAVSVNVSISPLSSATYYMTNYALSVQNLGSSVPVDQRYRLINWTTRGSSSNFTSRIASNITWPRSSLGTVDYDAGIAATDGWNSPPGGHWCIGHMFQSVDLYTGAVLFTDSTNDTLHESPVSGSTFVVDRGKMAFGCHGRHWTCYDARTGKKLWESELLAYPWGEWPPYNTASYSFNESKGAIIALTYEGVYAIDWDNGKIIWHYTDSNSVPFENPYDATPYFTSVTIADGKVYTYNGEHTQSLPRARDWKLHCINATTGELIWKILNPMVPGAMADGYLTASNGYDGYMYVFGKGKSETTVTTPDVVVPKGTGVVIKGTVLDMSPAQPGTPCVAKDSMETQMEYLHLQMPIAGLWNNETITGVPVTLTAIGSDGTVTDIGTVTTNGYYGTFTYAWTPPKEDTYTIMASFNGDDSYGSSSAATGLVVGPAPASPTPTPTEQPQAAPDNTPLIYATAAIIAAIVIVGLLIILSLRKRQ